MATQEATVLRAVLLDLGGGVFVGDALLPGAREAVDRLKQAGLGLRYITNTTRTPRRLLLEKLARLQVPVSADELFMPAVAARRHIEAHGLTPHLLIHPALEEDFAGLPQDRAPAVVVGDAAEGFTYRAMNSAFRALEEGAAFLALARNRSFQDSDRGLSLDAGPFVVALEFATRREAIVLGKPSADFFRAALDGLGCKPGEVAMVGDDVESDIAGAQAAGLVGLLVRTGKYREGDEAAITPRPTAVCADLAAAADWILAQGPDAGRG